ncbi:MAG: ABC-F type ribosomal protection protein [Clostridiales bacterium]|jgi:lincosamide and streptogramin A transport system ATP-binding/permease protein|nr:ABC-F type ribosomal protection protein [Clostridiales bacterium]
MSQIKVSNLTFAYEGSYENVFDNVSFQIDTDWKLGFTGRNGRGKTTFLNLLLGKYKYQGSITSSASFEYFPYEVKDKSKPTIDVLREICFSEEWEMVRELSLLEVKEEALERPFESLSLGEQTKVLLSALFLNPERFPLIDEPTNHLDFQARKAASSYLSKKNGFLLVSHDRAFLDSCIDYILAINRMNIEIQKGNLSSWLKNKQNQDSLELSRNDELKKDMNRLKQAARRTAEWSGKVEKTKIGAADKGYIGHKAAKMMKRSKSIEGRILNEAEEKSKLLKNIEPSEDLKLFPQKHHSKQLARFFELSINYGRKVAVREASFSIEQGDRIALCGRNGSGKSSILKLLTGDGISYSGLMEKASNLEISYVSQDVSHLKGSISSFITQSRIDGTLFRGILRKLDFERSLFDADISNCSEGQKKKILIARSLCEKAHLYVWDEPLNYIDIYARLQIENLIVKYSPTLLFVEHDDAFCEKICTKRIHLQ